VFGLKLPIAKTPDEVPSSSEQTGPINQRGHPGDFTLITSAPNSDRPRGRRKFLQRGFGRSTRVWPEKTVSVDIERRLGS
jgi:hypothetical protein